MRKFFAFCVCMILLSVVLIPHSKVFSQRNEDSRQRYAEDRMIVKLKAGAESGVDEDLMAEEIVRASGVRAQALTPRRHGGLQLIQLNNRLSVEEAVRRANQDPRVEFAEPDYLVYAAGTVPNDPYFNQMWGLSNSGCTLCDPSTQSFNIDATQAWDITTGSNDVVAVVLDTGVDLQHEDLAANAWVNTNEIPGNGVDDDGNGFVDDVNGWNFYDGTNQTFTDGAQDLHGTHVAGSIGAVGNNGIGVTGVAWRVKIMSLKFLGGLKGSGSTSNAVRGIRYAIEQRSRGVNVRVINASWGGGSDSQALRQAISDANDAGILFVCAAGNGGTNIDEEPDFPASYSAEFSNTISVAALASSGYVPSFSNTGHLSVSLAAPGEYILSTGPGNQYRTLTGTSMSTPYVSGMAVLVWSHEPSLTPQQVKQRIVDTSEPLPSLVSIVSRSGRANAYYALTNRIAPPQSPSVQRVTFTKRTVIVDGLGFVDGSAIIEADGVALPAVSYDNSYALANGTLTRLVADIGKKPLKKAFPAFTSVVVTVLNVSTGQRSPTFTIARF